MPLLEDPGIAILPTPEELELVLRHRREENTAPTWKKRTARPGNYGIPRPGEFVTRLRNGPRSSAQAGRLSTAPGPKCRLRPVGLQPTLLEDQPNHPLPDVHRATKRA